MQWRLCLGMKVSSENCKLVGSKLETVNDIENRIKLVNYSYSTLKPILSQKECKTDIKLSIFNALIESIFLYNSEIWSLTQTLENDIDVFQRKLLRKRLWDINTPTIENTGHQTINYIK